MKHQQALTPLSKSPARELREKAARSLRIASWTFGLGCCFAFVAEAQETTGTGARNFWRDPAFVEGFMGTYGFATDIEPRIDSGEQDLLRELAGLMENDLSAAAERLEGEITADSSAALDFVLGNLRFQLDETGAAARHYEAALAKFPKFMRAHKNLGMVRVVAGDFGAAADSLTRAIELGGGDGNTYGLLGLSRLNRGRYHSAEGAYRQALLHDPENVQWRLGTARVLLEQERYREAAALFEELIDDHPDRAEYYLHQANAFLGMERPRRAAANYEAARRLGGATAGSLANLGDIYLNEAIPDLALDAYREALHLESPLPLPRALRAARSLSEHRAWDEAGELLAAINEHYEETGDEDTELDRLRIRSRLQLHSGDADAAVRNLERIVERDPRDGASLLLLARHYADHGDPERAELLFERAARAPGHEAEARLRHAEFLVRQNRLEEAADLLRRAQEIRPRESVARYLERVENALRSAR